MVAQLSGLLSGASDIGERGQAAAGASIALLAQRAADMIVTDAAAGRELLSAVCAVLDDLVVAFCADASSPAMRESMAIALYHVRMGCALDCVCTCAHEPA